MQLSGLLLQIFGNAGVTKTAFFVIDSGLGQGDAAVLVTGVMLIGGKGVDFPPAVGAHKAGAHIGR